MSTKPVTLPRWATNLTNNTAPSSGQQDTGWAVGQMGVSSYENWKAYWAYKWCEYLNDGALSGNHSIAGTLSTTGAISTSSSVTAASSVTARDSLHTDRRLTWIHASTARSDAGGGVAPQYLNAAWSGDGCTGGTLEFPINLQIGDRIQKWALYVRKTSATGTITVEMFQHNRAAGTVTQIGTTQTLATNNPGFVVMTENALDFPVTSGGAIKLIVTPSGVAGDTYMDLAVQYTRPTLTDPAPA